MIRWPNDSIPKGSVYTSSMQPERIASLLSPFLPAGPLSLLQLEQVSNHLDLLLKWNARINLTGIRAPDEIVARHFGESFFLAQTLFPLAASPRATRNKANGHIHSPAAAPSLRHHSISCAIDLGSGAGFPALPLKIWAPALQLTLIESQNKKATFLKEVIRTNRLMDINVFSGRAEAYTGARAHLVTMRAVERFAHSLPLAATLLAAGGTLALLIGASQLSQAGSLLPTLRWNPPIPLPKAHSRVVLLGQRP